MSATWIVGMVLCVIGGAVTGTGVARRPSRPELLILGSIMVGVGTALTL